MWNNDEWRNFLIFGVPVSDDDLYGDGDGNKGGCAILVVIAVLTILGFLIFS